jgi:hypothetical protein
MKEICLILCLLIKCTLIFPQKIDRYAVVTRHNVILNNYAYNNALQVGNGQIAFAIDATGLQSFDEQLGTYSDWGWHSFPKPGNIEYENVLSELDFYGHRATYADPTIIKRPGWAISKTGQVSSYESQSLASLAENKKAAYWYYRFNPHRLHLGQVGMEIKLNNGELAALNDLQEIRQELDLWSGTVNSTFKIEGIQVKVTTICHPKQDILAVKISSPLIKKERLKIFWNFPYMQEDPSKGPDFSLNDAHVSQITKSNKQGVDIERKLDNYTYYVSIKWDNRSILRHIEKNKFYLLPDKVSDEFFFITSFSQKPVNDLPDYKGTYRENKISWEGFWKTGGAIDLSESIDPRWKELERRIVLSRYLTAIQCSGYSPPPETGLVNNSRWYGKFHLEMIAWHGVHFALWSHEEMLENWMNWLLTEGIKGAKNTAERQGYKGVRWNKMTDKYASWESPGATTVYRITQQGHVIYLAELLYYINNNKKILDKYSEMVFKTAEFMADFVNWDNKTQRYVIGPPVKSGAESVFAPDAQNPTVELSYWAYGLQTAQKWKERLNLPRNKQWDDILEKLAFPPIKDSVYINMESHPDDWRRRPAWLEVYGCMPGVRIDTAIMLNTYKKITGDYDYWNKWIWGTDFPMFAMCAARLGKTQDAIDWLLYETDRNLYLPNGANFGGAIPITYLPANGGLLWAVAMMCAGWDGAPERYAPGFPANGLWKIKFENLRRTF